MSGGGLSVSWQEGAAVTVVLLGLAAGAFLVAQRPSFWIELGVRLGKALLPLAWRYVSKRMPPEGEAAWRAAARQGQGDEWLRLQRYGERIELSSPNSHGVTVIHAADNLDSCTDR